MMPKWGATQAVSDLLILIFSYTLAAYFVVGADLSVWLHSGGSRQLALLLLALAFFSLLQVFSTSNWLSTFQQVCMLLGFGFYSQALIGYLEPSAVLPRRIMLYGTLDALVLLPVWRLTRARIAQHDRLRQRIVFLGHSETAEKVAAGIRARAELGMDVCGFICESSEDWRGAEKSLGTIGDISAIVRGVKADRVVIALGERRHRLPVGELLDIRLSGILIEHVSDTYEYVLQQVCLHEVQVAHVLFGAPFRARKVQSRIRNVYSTALALAAIAVAGPLMIAVAIYLRITSRESVLVKEPTFGLRGSVFSLYGFRTSSIRPSRSTSLIRSLKLDQLPQLFNVLLGDMALVGPRPILLMEANESATSQLFRYRFAVKPGLTGWAQIQRERSTQREGVHSELGYDLFYVKNASVAMDFHVLLSAGIKFISSVVSKN